LTILAKQYEKKDGKILTLTPVTRYVYVLLHQPRSQLEGVDLMNLHFGRKVLCILNLEFRIFYQKYRQKFGEEFIFIGTKTIFINLHLTPI
jgi:hypothetical protein